MSIHPFFNVLANEIGRAVAHAFKEKHKRDIDVELLLVPDGQGNRRPEFRFQMAQPGLLPTALEREFFAGAIAGYRTCIDIAMEVEAEFPEMVPDAPPEPIELGKTARGFPIGEFNDLYGEPCVIQTSSLAEQPAIWLGMKVSAQMHLGLAEVRRLLPFLVRFAKSGSITEEARQ